MNKKGFAISGIIYSILILFLILMFGVLSLLGSRKMIFDKVKKEVIEELTGKYDNPNINDWEDGSGANKPELYTNMIPIKYDDNLDSWVYANTKEEWYDYTKQHWANAAILKSNPSKSYNVGDSILISDVAQMYVWIPRYKYTVFNGNEGEVAEQLINVEFESGTATTGTVKCYDLDTNREVCSDKTQINNAIVDGTSTYTHPAFCFGRKYSDGSCNGTELNGIWVGKFEVSGEATSAGLTVLPNKNSLAEGNGMAAGVNVSDFFAAMSGVAESFNVKDGEVYADSHMMKNMDWGAVAYLKQSEYGLGTTDIAPNNYYNTSNSLYHMTGCGSEIGTTEETTICSAYDTTNGMKASTTGNIYGVYDMSGGAYEYVMGFAGDDSNGNLYISYSPTFFPDSKYYDIYATNDSPLVQSRGKLGDATKETSQSYAVGSDSGWYSESAQFPSNDYLWFVRGGRAQLPEASGVFEYNRSDGTGSSIRSSRLVITKPTQANVTPPPSSDNNEPNEPILFTNMIPVTYNTTTSKWNYADINTNWYDYSNQKWANAVILKASPSKTYTVGNDIEIDDIAQMYVWIPRYKYTIFNGNNGSVNEQLINVEFEKGTQTTGTVKCYDAVSGSGTSSEVCTDSTQTNNAVVDGVSSYTHPAFCFGGKFTNGVCDGTELTGIWVGKFEVSGTASAANLTVLPNQNTLTKTTVSAYFNAMSGVANSFNIKDTNSTLADSHMMKNMEWGAVAYLKQSEYGLGTTDIASNNYRVGGGASYTYMTGCGSVVGTTTTTTTCTPYNEANGQAASTTGNIYGIYDMAGGAGEYVMGNVANSSGNFQVSSAGTFSPDTKYYDAYKYNTNSTVHRGGKLGDATKETLKTSGSATGGWYSDYSGFPYSSSSWFTRSGVYDGYLGIFGFSYGNGSSSTSYSSRLVITEATPLFDDGSGANQPKLYTNMIPVTYNTTTSKWKYADKTEKWYDYNSGQWANAVILKTSPSKTYTIGSDIEISDIAQMYVWIPRYKYTIFNGNNGSVNEQLINVTFEKGTATTGTVRCYDAVSGSGTSSEVCIDSTQTNNAVVDGVSTYTHPAFCFGRKDSDGDCTGTELTGLWIGKFEVSGEATATNLTVLPNKASLVSTGGVTQFFTAMSGVSSSFNLKDENQTLADSHMMKNMDWGAVAYLKQSEYGLGITDIAPNNYYNTSKAVYYMTGCGSEIGTETTTYTCAKYDTTNGMKASTTGNIYGVYDMSGGAGEYVMGNMVNSSGQFYPSSAATFSPDSKYYDAYTYDNLSNKTHGRGKLGDATKETLKNFGNVDGGWYSDNSEFPYSSYSWFWRGGHSNDKAEAGIFNIYRSLGATGVSSTSRLVITRP